MKLTVNLTKKHPNDDGVAPCSKWGCMITRVVVALFTLGVLPLLHEFNVQVWFNGHDHDLQHLVADGLNQAVNRLLETLQAG